MFREMQLFGLSPDGFAISHALQACDITEAYGEAAGVIRGLWKLGTPIDDRTYTVAFSVLARGAYVKVSPPGRERGRRRGEGGGNRVLELSGMT